MRWFRATCAMRFFFSGSKMKCSSVETFVTKQSSFFWFLQKFLWKLEVLFLEVFFFFLFFNKREWKWQEIVHCNLTRKNCPKFFFRHLFTVFKILGKQLHSIFVEKLCLSIFVCLTQCMLWSLVLLLRYEHLGRPFLVEKLGFTAFKTFFLFSWKKQFPDILNPCFF